MQAACNGKIVSILENEETGMTVTMDIGNGYRAIYGQLKSLRAKVGDMVKQGVIFGYVEEPTRYFVKEGSNLYFSINKAEIIICSYHKSLLRIKSDKDLTLTVQQVLGL